MIPRWAVPGGGVARLAPDDPLVRLSGVTITLAGVVGALLTLVVSLVVALVVRRAVMRLSARAAARKATLYAVAQSAFYTVLTIGFLVAIGVLGVPVSRLTVLAGAVGVGLGFGLQSIFSNFVSGLILLFDRSLKIGDFVELESGVNGEVREIKIRFTRIVTNDNIDILVPNSEFVEGRVVNWTHRDVSRRLRVGFGVAYGTDKELVKRAALEAAAEVPFTLALEGPRRPQVWLTEFGESSLNFELVVWLGDEPTKRPAAVQAAYNWALHSALERHGIEIPFAQRDLNVRSLFGLEERAALAALGLTGAEAERAGPTHDEAHGQPRGGDAEGSDNDAVSDVTSPLVVADDEDVDD